MSAPRPVIYLDVDGPLNPFGSRGRKLPPGYVKHRTRPAGWEAPGAPLSVLLNPAHGPQLLSLPGDLVWATSWGTDANLWIGPHIGLPELPTIGPASPRRDHDWFHQPHWKMDPIITHAAGRPFVWLDDEIRRIDRNHVRDTYPGEAKLHFVNPSTGITEEDIEVVRAWLLANGGTPS